MSAHREKFIYLAASPSNQICKVGMSIHPQKRVLEVGLGKCYAFPSHENRLVWDASRRFRVPAVITFRLIASWSLGVVSRRHALDVEKAIHLAVRPIAAWWMWEFYRLSASRATAFLDDHIEGNRVVPMRRSA